MSSMKFMCAACDANFTRKDNLKLHIYKRCPRSTAVKNKITVNFFCAKCDAGFTRKDSLKFHIFNKCPFVKSKALNLETFHFKSFEEFSLWKDNIEQKTVSKFVKNYRSWITKCGMKTRYVCHRAGYIRVKDQSSRKKSLKRKGSCKIDNYCTAYILSKKCKDGTITVQYNQKHCNHPIEIKHLPLSFQDKAEFASKLREGVSMDRILNDVRDTLSDPQSLTRKHLVTKHDLRNIKRDFNISFKERLSSHDAVSVDLLIDQYKKRYGIDSPFLYFKQQGVGDKIFENDDILLVMMNPTQMKFLQKFGPDKICLDSIHCTTGYGFFLNTILVVDDLDLCVPVAHMISNKENAVFLKKFFEVVKTKCGVIKSKTIMTDDFPAYFNAWVQVMGPVENHLLCTWHVDRNWRKNLPLIKTVKVTVSATEVLESSIPATEKIVDSVLDTENVKGSVSVAELKKEVYKAVRTVMEETNQDVFPDIVEKLVQKLKNDVSTKLFAAYFEKEYSKRYKMWAYAFRKHFGINTNEKIEAIHRLIETNYLKGKKNKKLDFLIVTLLRLNCIITHKRMSVLLMKGDTHTLRKIQDRHRESLKIPKEDVVLTDNETILVKSQSNRSNAYTITRAADHCECQLRCPDCELLCLHMYSCTCVDNTIIHNLCKHIHAFVRVVTFEEVFFNNSLDTDSDITADTNASNNRKNAYAKLDGIQSQSMDQLNTENNIGEYEKSVYDHWVVIT